MITDSFIARSSDGITYEMGPTASVEKPKVSLTFDEPNHVPARFDLLVDAEYRIQIKSPLNENDTYKARPYPNSVNGNHSDPADIKVSLLTYSKF